MTVVRKAPAVMLLALLISVVASPTVSWAKSDDLSPAERVSPGPQDALVYPVMGPRLSGVFGSRKHPIRRVRHHHEGIDLAAPQGAPIRAIAAGRVMFADPHGGYGNLIVIEHPDGLTSHYGHCSRIAVQPGAVVRAGEVIGAVGSSGLSTGPHLHFELRKTGKALNPERLLPGLAAGAEG